MKDKRFVFYDDTDTCAIYENQLLRYCSLYVVYRFAVDGPLRRTVKLIMAAHNQ